MSDGSDQVDDYVIQFTRDGYSIHENVLSLDEVDHLRDAIAAIQTGDEVRRKRNTYGVRNLLEICPAVRELARSPEVRQFVTPIIGDLAFATRSIFFDKVPGANWSLGWHQDSVISVKQRIETRGFVGWSNKAGVWQVQPPADILGEMIAIRVHLDDCLASNGALRVIPGSHKSGWLDDQIDEWKKRGPQITCDVGIGGVVAMCPLTLHASSPSKQASHRRVIHIEFANQELPGDLDWNNRV